MDNSNNEKNNKENVKQRKDIKYSDGTVPHNQYINTSIKQYITRII